MCGIVALLTTASPAPRGDLVRAMVRRLHHRGPDDQGGWSDGPIALGHARLSILDISPLGHQPMTSASGRFVIAFNGEIYNFLALRDELIAAGASFRGHSDTEVLLAACERWGLVDTLPRLVGMFAIALWDGHARILHLARDRMGEKPLYYGWLPGGGFMAASELKAARAHPEFRGDVDRDALAQYFRFGFFPGARTIWRDLFKLLPGTRLEVHADAPEQRVQPQVWWSAATLARLAFAAPRLTDPVAAVAELDALLRQAIGGQLVADVPVGAFLSGGIDSSTVVAVMQALSARPVKTFTIGFNERSHDEAVYAKAVAKHLGTDHTELYVTSEEARAVIPLLPTLYDEPFSDPSQIPTYLVSRLARRHVTVALSGDGGDELFGGYPRYALVQSLWRRMGQLPTLARRGAAGALRMVPPGGWDALWASVGWLLPRRLRRDHPGHKFHKLAGVLPASCPEELYRRLVSYWEVPPVLGGLEPPSVHDGPDFLSAGSLIERVMIRDQLSYLPDDILVKVDRAAMAVSLETRVPLLDHRLVEFTWRLAPELKMQVGAGKVMLRHVLDRYVPRHLIDRPKMGFGIPLGVWLRGPLREWAEGLLAEDRLRREGFLDPVPIRKIWNQHLHGRRNWEDCLWSVLMFQAWWAAQCGR